MNTELTLKSTILRDISINKQKDCLRNLEQIKSEREMWNEFWSVYEFLWTQVDYCDSPVPRIRAKETEERNVQKPNFISRKVCRIKIELMRCSMKSVHKHYIYELVCKARQEIQRRGSKEHSELVKPKKMIQETANPVPCLFIKQNLEGLGWKFLRRWRSLLDGLMMCRRNALTALAFAYTVSSNCALVMVVIDDDDDLAEALRRFRWKLQRKEPGWVVGEQRHLRELPTLCNLELTDLDFVAIELKSWKKRWIR